VISPFLQNTVYNKVLADFLCNVRENALCAAQLKSANVDDWKGQLDWNLKFVHLLCNIAHRLSFK
ncbi:hypothetical protein, partial [Enterobacter hormaechei]